MKKSIFILIVLSLVFAFPVMAKNPKSPADYNGLNKGKSEVVHLYLYEKDAAWNIVSDGAWGKMTINKDKVVFNGHGLMQEADYTLIRYTEPWPGGAVCLAEGMSDEYGDIHLAGEMLEGGAKIWLVSSADVNCDTQKMTGWNPAEYLFEYNLLP